jgi:hypothetical protein
VYYDILHSYMGYRTCYYRCFMVGYASHIPVGQTHRLAIARHSRASSVDGFSGHRGSTAYQCEDFAQIPLLNQLRHSTS